MLASNHFIYTVISLAYLGLGQNISSLISSLPELSNLTAYLASVPETDLSLSSLQNKTFLAPTNEAFVKLLNSTAGAPIDSGGTDFLTLIRYQILDGTYKSHNFDTITTTALNNSAYTILDSHGVYVTYVAETAAVTYVRESGNFLSGLGVLSVPGVGKKGNTRGLKSADTA